MRVAFLFMMSLFLGCGTVKVTDINKKYVQPGRANLFPYIEYSAKFKVLKPLLLQEVNLNKSEKIEKYSLINLKNGLIINKGKKLVKGNYYFSTKVTNLDYKDSNDTLIFNFDNNGKEIRIIESVHKAKTKIMK